MSPAKITATEQVPRKLSEALQLQSTFCQVPVTGVHLQGAGMRQNGQLLLSLDLTFQFNLKNYYVYGEWVFQ